MRTILLAFLLAAAPALAQDDTVALAATFVERLGYQEEFVRFRDQCARQHGAIAPEALAAQNPDRFGDIRPGTRKWPSVVKAYETYVVEACSRPTQEEFLVELAQFYAQVLTAPQLRAAIAFYSSATGKALAAARLQAEEAEREAWLAGNSLHQAEVTAEFERRIAGLVEAK